MSYAKKRQLLIDFCDQFGHIIIKKIETRLNQKKDNGIGQKRPKTLIG